ADGTRPDSLVGGTRPAGSGDRIEGGRPAGDWCFPGRRQTGLGGGRARPRRAVHAESGRSVPGDLPALRRQDFTAGIGPAGSGHGLRQPGPGGHGRRHRLLRRHRPRAWNSRAAGDPHQPGILPVRLRSAAAGRCRRRHRTADPSRCRSPAVGVAGYAVGAIFAVVAIPPSLGIVETAITLALVSVDVSITQAVATAVLFRLNTLWLPMLAGYIAVRHARSAAPARSSTA